MKDKDKCGMCVNSFSSKTVCYECRNNNYKYFEKKKGKKKW